jgi:diguanylate cyclase (GGDEF)-like protein/PAS domain S-box-containing protein
MMSDEVLTSARNSILVIEDNLAFGELLVSTLTEEGYRCHVASSGAGALTWLASNTPALIILDYSLPDMTGDAFISVLKVQKVDLPFVVVTGRDDASLAVQMIKNGASDFVIKDTTLLDRLPVVMARTLLEAENSKKLRSMEYSLRQSEARLARAQRIARVGSWEYNLNTRDIYISDELFRIIGCDPAAVSSNYEWFARRINPTDLPVVRKAIMNTLTTGDPLDIAYRIMTCEGNEIIVSSQAELEYGADGKPLLLIGTTLDITARAKAEEEIQNLVNFDVLTGLPNRTLLMDRLNQAIMHAARGGVSVGVLFLDLDRFKGVNDSLGHKVGDTLLRMVSDRLRACVRESDTLARIGGDEFVAVLTGVANEDGSSMAASKILTIISEPFVIDGQEIYVTGSIGISLYPADGDDGHTLLKHADLAMYQAKEQDRNNFQFFSREMNVKVVERMILESSMRRAVERDEFVLLYQPQVDVNTRKIVGFEALLRWEHPDLGFLAPDKFISLAEETALIVPIGEWVLREACRQAKAWQDAGLPKVKVAVNLSGRQFRVQLDQVVAAILMEIGLEPCWIELELTESILMGTAAGNVQLLKRLAEMGFSLSIDDFGTGYSSLAYLKNFPLARLKIDRSFVRDITTNPEDAAIAKIIIDMARTLRMHVTAEGVEELEQLELLSAYGCTEMQGYYFSKPVRADVAAELLKKEFVF